VGISYGGFNDKEHKTENIARIVIAQCERVANCNCIDCDISIENPLQTARKKISP